MMKRIFEGTENVLRSEVGPSPGKGLAGLPASPGRASEQARVIRTPEGLDRLLGCDPLLLPLPLR